MAAPYIGEIRAFGFHFAPTGWAFCNGQTIAISQNPTLYSIIGTTYGGDGVNTFAVPNLEDSAPMHWGNGLGLSPRTIGEPSGTQSVTLLQTEMPGHTHMIQAQIGHTGTQETGAPGPTAWLGSSSPGRTYASGGSPIDVQFSPKAIGVSGGSLPHENMQPVLGLNFCIALVGIFPSRN